VDLLNDHIDGISFRKLEDKYGLSKSRIQRIVYKLLKALPDSNMVTYTYCTKYSDILVPDAKYLSVKGYDRKISFLWGIDYFTHDFPVVLLAPSESFASWNKYFKMIKELHSYELIVCDDNRNIKDAARFWVPKVQIQSCYNHLKEGIRRLLKVRSDSTYRSFMTLIEETFSKKRSLDDFNNRLFYIFKQYRNDTKILSILTNIEKNKEELLSFRGFRHAPVTTNIIEGFNSHLDVRLDGIRKFEDFNHAKLWLNAYVLKRRTTKYKCCKGRFKSLNGYKPLQLSTSKGVDFKGLSEWIN
jgi:hypothetical protein